MKLPIFHIIGLPGAGKTTLARSLSKKLKIPIYSIGSYRMRLPMTVIGEADAWLVLFSDLSKRGWGNCILETTGMNARERFLEAALPLDTMIVIKLEASQKVLMERIAKKRKREQGGKWLYSSEYKDKYDFVKKLYPNFKNIQGHFAIKTDRMTKKEVLTDVLKKAGVFLRHD